MVEVHMEADLDTQPLGDMLWGIWPHRQVMVGHLVELGALGLDIVVDRLLPMAVTRLLMEPV